jgi:beta-N-acetylhexosaminidase
VAEVHAAIVGAVASGRLAGERVAEAAERVSAVVKWSAPRSGGADRAAAVAAARRALLAEGDVRVDAPLVVVLDAEPSIAAGPAGYGFADAARRVWADASFDAADGAGRPLVLVLRDAARRPEQQAAARDLVARNRRTVVVETGLPGWRPEGASGYVATRGAGRVNLDAAAELLARG